MSLLLRFEHDDLTLFLMVTDAPGWTMPQLDDDDVLLISGIVGGLILLFIIILIVLFILMRRNRSKQGKQKNL